MTDSSPVQAENTILSAVNEMFGDVGPQVTLSSGRVVTVVTAKVKHLAEISAFMKEFAVSSTADELAGLLTRVSDRQAALISKGESPYLLNTNEIAKTAINEMATIADIAALGLEQLSKLVPMFTDVSSEEFSELDLADGAVVLYAIFGRNYTFFTQRVRLLIQDYIAQKMRAQTQAKAKKPGK